MIIPRRIFGLISGISKPFIYKKKKKFFLLVAVHSALNFFSIKGLILKIKSPFLHHSNNIVSFISFYDRTIILCKKNFYIMDYFIPTTRIFILKKKISTILHVSHFFLALNEDKKKITLFDPWKLNIKLEIIFKQEILAIKHKKTSKKKRNILILKINNELEFWDFKKMICIFKINLKLKFSILNIDFEEKKKKITLLLSSSFLLFFDIKEKNIKLFSVGSRENNIKSLVFFSNLKKFIFLFGHKKYLIFDKLNKNNVRIEFLIHFGKINPIGFLENTNIFLTLGLFDNTIAIHKFSKKKVNFKLLKIKRDNYLPIEKIKIISSSNFSIIFANKKGFWGIFKNNSSRIFDFNDYFKKKIIKKKKLIRHLCTEKDVLEKKNTSVIISFYKIKTLFMWNVSDQNTFIKKTNMTIIQTLFKNINCLIFLSNIKSILIGFEENIICKFRIINEKIEQNFFNHHKSSKKKKDCFIKILNKNHNENQFLSCCSHGTIKLWNVKNFKNIKSLKLKNKIIRSKWFSESDTIIILCNNIIFYTIFPENFVIQQIFVGHNKFITDFYLFDNSKILISASMDNTIKLWNLFTAKCLSSVLLEFPVVEMEIDLIKNHFLTAHHNTIGIGYWKNMIEIKIVNKNLRKSFFKKKLYFNEKNSFVLNKLGKFSIKKFLKNDLKNFKNSQTLVSQKTEFYFNFLNSIKSKKKKNIKLLNSWKK